VFFTSIFHILLEIDGFRGWFNCAFAAYLCRFVHRFAGRFVGLDGAGSECGFKFAYTAEMGDGEAHISIMRFLVIILRKLDGSFFCAGVKELPGVGTVFDA
jgi:hypothetical protein